MTTIGIIGAGHIGSQIEVVSFLLLLSSIIVGLFHLVSPMMCARRVATRCRRG
jgi:hypothetical protein